MPQLQENTLNQRKHIGRSCKVGSTSMFIFSLYKRDWLTKGNIQYPNFVDA